MPLADRMECSFPFGADIAIRRNTIFSNTGLGIDLGGDGVTQNDPGDGDTIPNALQNFPIITSVTGDSSQTTITGTLNSTPNSTFFLDFYSSSTCDPSGNGEGATPFGLGSIAIGTDSRMETEASAWRCPRRCLWGM